MTSGSTFVENLKGWQLWTEFKAFRFVAAFKQPLWKAFWIVVIVGTFSGFAVQSVFVLTDFFHYNVDTVVQLKSVEGLPFPAVTICNLNPIRKSAMEYVEELSDLQTVYNYLSHKKAHEAGTHTSSGTPRNKRSAKDKVSLYEELYDDVPIIAPRYVRNRPKRQDPGATCFMSPSQLSTSTTISSTTEASTATITLSDFNCGGELEATQVVQTLSNPINPSTGTYDNLVRCKWLIRGPSAASVFIKLTEIDMEENEKCGWDYIVISATDYTTSDALFQGTFDYRYCNMTQVGTEIPQVIADGVYVYFVSDGSNTYRGFTAEYRLEFACGGELEASHVTQTFSNPINPSSGVYDDDVRCKWVIRLPTSGGIVIKLTEMDMEECSECDCDYLLISASDFTTYDALNEGAYSATYSEALTYDNRNCNKRLVGTEISQDMDEEIYIYFVTDGSVTHKGFTVEYRLVTTTTTELTTATFLTTTTGEGTTTSVTETTTADAPTTSTVVDTSTTFLHNVHDLPENTNYAYNNHDEHHHVSAELLSAFRTDLVDDQHDHRNCNSNDVHYRNDKAHDEHHYRGTQLLSALRNGHVDHELDHRSPDHAYLDGYM